jgi:hypothetical protein
MPRLEAASGDAGEHGQRLAVERERVAVQEAAVLEEQTVAVGQIERNVAGLGRDEKDGPVLEDERVAALRDLRRLVLREDPCSARSIVPRSRRKDGAERR